MASKPAQSSALLLKKSAAMSYMQSRLSAGSWAWVPKSTQFLASRLWVVPKQSNAGPTAIGHELRDQRQDDLLNRGGGRGAGRIYEPAQAHVPCDLRRHDPAC